MSRALVGNNRTPVGSAPLAFIPVYSRPQMLSRIRPNYSVAPVAKPEPRCHLTWLEIADSTPSAPHGSPPTSPRRERAWRVGHHASNDYKKCPFIAFPLPVSKPKTPSPKT